MLKKIWKPGWVVLNTKYDDNLNMISPDTYFHNGIDSYLHAITRPNKLLRISENGDITYSMR